MVSYQTDPRVDDYIDRLPDWQREICRQVRDIAHDADPEIFETIKRSVQPYFVSPRRRSSEDTSEATQERSEARSDEERGNSAVPRGPSGDQKPGKAVPPGNVCALLATKDHVNVFLYDGGLTPDPAGIITGGHGNQTGRTISIYRDDPINVQALTEMLREIAATNRAGGWRTIKPT